MTRAPNSGNATRAPATRELPEGLTRVSSGRVQTQRASDRMSQFSKLYGIVATSSPFSLLAEEARGRPSGQKSEGSGFGSGAPLASRRGNQEAHLFKVLPGWRLGANGNAFFSSPTILGRPAPNSSLPHEREGLPKACSGSLDMQLSSQSAFGSVCCIAFSSCCAIIVSVNQGPSGRRFGALCELLLGASRTRAESRLASV